MSCDNIIQTIGIIAGAIAALFGVVTYFWDKMVSRRDRTIEKIGGLLEAYQGKYRDLSINDHFMEHVGYLSRVEQFCIAVDSRVYSKRTLQKYGSKFICRLYSKYRNNVIEKRRADMKDNSYQYLEDLAKTFEKSKRK